MNTLRVLIVEDVENDAALVLHELGRGAYDVTHLRVDTAEALREALRTREWDLVVSDFSLPSFTAMEVLKILAVSGPDLPCIVVSGTIEEEGAIDAMKSGAGDLIAKDRLARLLPAVSRELQKAAERRQRQTAEVALGEARDRMRFAMDAAGVGTWESDVLSGKTIWSDLLERLHGRQEGDFDGTFEAFIAGIHPEDQSRVREEIAESSRDHTESRLEYRVVWPDRSIHWISRVGQTFYDEAGRPVRSAGVGMDITTQKNLETQYRQAQRMESIGNLAGGIAHDFNNLLTAILGYSNFVLDDLPPHQDGAPNRMRSDLEQVRNAGERAAALTSQLLAFSRKQIIQPTILNINKIFGNLEPMLRRLIGEDIDLAVRPLNGLWSAQADAGQIEQVIMNLVVNARDAMPTGGKMTVETANVDLDDAYPAQHMPVAPGSYVMLAVSDTGMGMSPDVQARIFEPFFTTKAKDRGTGLGLATVYGIVKQSNGYIWVYSEPNEGTTFKVYLPAVKDTPECVVQKVHTDLGGGDETILLVEDDERVRLLAKTLLVRCGYTVIEASEAEEALPMAARHSGPIHLLLTDVILPGMNGRLLAQQLCERYPQTKVLYMSGYTDDAIVHHGVLAPGVAFLQKPFTPAAFARAVREVLDTGS